jgi:cyanophycin synthetase
MHTVKRPKIISITGTKGKSTIAYILAQILEANTNVLRVDTTGYYINGKLRGKFADSSRTAGLVPTVAPGRFLISMQDIDEFTAVLECSLGCSNAPGLGYSHHSVGVFANVFEDHLGSTKRLKSQKNIAEAKNFIFSRIRPDGYAVFNADDKMVCSQLNNIKEGVKRIPCGIDFTAFNVQAHLREGGVCVTLENGWIVVKSEKVIRKIVKVKDVSWTFQGLFLPSIRNLLLVVGALLGHNKGSIPLSQRQLLKFSKLDPYGGRLTPLISDKGVLIIADYAHEKNSLRAVGEMAHTLKSGKGSRVIGVVRLAYDRTDELIVDTAQYIAPYFDEFIVYDKIDGFWRKPKKTIGLFKMRTGYVSKVLSSNLKKNGAIVSRIVREDDAIMRAAQMAKKGDVVVVIVNDEITRSIGFIREKFNADFV